MIFVEKKVLELNELRTIVRPMDYSYSYSLLFLKLLFDDDHKSVIFSISKVGFIEKFL